VPHPLLVQVAHDKEAFVLVTSPRLQQHRDNQGSRAGADQDDHNRAQ